MAWRLFKSHGMACEKEEMSEFYFSGVEFICLLQSINESTRTHVQTINENKNERFSGDNKTVTC